MALTLIYSLHNNNQIRRLVQICTDQIPLNFLIWIESTSSVISGEHQQPRARSCWSEVVNILMMAWFPMNSPDRALFSIQAYLYARKHTEVMPVMSLSLKITPWLLALSKYWYNCLFKLLLTVLGFHKKDFIKVRWQYQVQCLRTELSYLVNK